jgi:hypothetical protein
MTPVEPTATRVVTAFLQDTVGHHLAPSAEPPEGRLSRPGAAPAEPITVALVSAAEAARS